MEGQPVLLITILAIVAILQIQSHRPIGLIRSMALAPTLQAEQPSSLALCSGIELELGCALNGMLDGATSSPSPR